jgi:hypothetical protein
MNRRALLARLVRGEVRNVHFGDFQKLVEGFGFRFARQDGSHHIERYTLIMEGGDE